MDKISITSPNATYGARYRRNNNQMLPYAWAHDKIYNKKVADLGSGRGHGSLLMSNFATSIDQYEIDQTEVNRAKQHNYFCPTNIYNCDLDTVEFTEKYDVICGFEVLDHVKDPGLLLKKVSLVCDTFLFCVPHSMPDPKHFITFHSDFDVIDIVSPYFKRTSLIKENHNEFSSSPNFIPFRYFGISYAK